MTGTLLSCELESIRTRRDRTLAITLGTSELSPAKGSELLGLMNKIAAVYISPKETISQQEMNQVDEVNAEFNTKSKSQRQRGLLFLIWQEKHDGHETFNSFYDFRMESNISKLKTELDSLK